MQPRWTIRARVTNKSSIRTWSNSKGEGRLFSVDLLDESVSSFLFSGFSYEAILFSAVLHAQRLKLAAQQVKSLAKSMMLWPCKGIISAYFPLC